MRPVFFCSLLFLFLLHFGFAQHSLENDVNVTPLTIFEDPSLVPIHQQVKAIMEEGISGEAFPGAQLMVVKNGQMLFHEAYGFHTYDSLVPVGRNDLYDLASVTKIAGALPGLMKLVDEGKLDLDVPFSTYWTSWAGVDDKRDLTLREILAHQAGLHPYIVFVNYLKRNNGKFRKRYIRKEYSPKFPVKITDSLFLSRKFKDAMYKAIDRSAVQDEKKYKYSGLSFLLYPELIENSTDTSYRTFVRKTIYEPIGAHSLMFVPEGWYPEQLIVPTERDTVFRNSLIRGRVHDENASLMGGLSGNAGLFGTAEDLARLMQMYLQDGRFGNNQVISGATVNEFTRVQYPENGNRRGLGFDKPLLNNKGKGIEDAYPAPGASQESFGHSGFTGTFVWADPKGEWVFVFLSNRVYPFRSHSGIYSMNIRERLLQVFYDAYPD
ncbi:serine hydrolase domain-containing protein [Robertkochia flava]|uniref:serine hydrolase domain-containing protein n=1 Tax=Robertkochia flava TaxID=3447986 RepID=UPI001CCCB6C5|nr:serine hydrolase [Robertkochia marina]